MQATAGAPGELQIMYGLHGQRRLIKVELDCLPGHKTSRPVRVGNAAHDQIQLDDLGLTGDPEPGAQSGSGAEN